MTMDYWLTVVASATLFSGGGLYVRYLLNRPRGDRR